MKYLVYRYRAWRTRRGLDLSSLSETAFRHLEIPLRLNPAQAADRARFVVFDTEMTGLAEDDRLLSIGAVRIEASRINLGDAFSETVDPSRNIPPESILIHEIVPDMTVGRPDSAEVLPRFLDYIGSDVLIAHNARFDRDCLNREMLRHYGVPLQSALIDLVRLSRVNSHLREKYRLPGAVDDHSLEGLAQAYGLSLEERHSAFGDALTAALIFLRLMKALQRFGLSRVKHLLRIGGL